MIVTEPTRNPRMRDSYSCTRTGMLKADVMPHTPIGRTIAFVAVAVAFSWAQWLAVIASQRGWLAAHVSLGPLAIFGPLVAAVVILRGSDDRRRWWRSLLQWRMPPGIAFVAVFLSPVVFIGCLVIATAVMPGTPRVEAPPARSVAAVLAGMYLTAGVGEESGWRGFLLPELRTLVGPLVGSLIVAIVWFAWHLPLFWVAGATQQQISPFSFALGILSYSFILTWLVESAGNSTVPAMLFHTSANVTFWVAIVSVRHLPQYGFVSRAYLGAMAACGAVAATSLLCRERKAKRLAAQQGG